MIREALNYPPSGKHGSGAVVIGGIFFFMLAVTSVVSLFLLEIWRSVSLTGIKDGIQPIMAGDFLIILILVAAAGFYLCVRLVLRGYYVAVLRVGVGVTDPVAPSFYNIRIVIDGIKSAVILLVYLVPAVVLSGFGLLVRRSPTPNAHYVVSNTVGAFAFLLGLFALIAAAYIVPAAITLFAQHDSFWSAFEFSTVGACVLTEDYAVGWMFAGIMRTVLVPIAILLQLLLVGFFLRFYVHVSVQHLYALAVTSALELIPDDSNPDRDTVPTDEHSHQPTG